MNTQVRQYVEDAVTIDLTGLTKKGFVKEGKEGKTTGSINGHYLWSIGWRISNDMEMLQVNYISQKKSYSHSISIDYQPAHFGGHRMFLVCPMCNQRRKQLYISQCDIGCRKCQRLHYKSQSKTQTERDLDRYFRLSRKVDYFGLGAYLKRKYQHWETFSKIHKQMGSIHSKYPSIFN